MKLLTFFSFITICFFLSQTSVVSQSNQDCKNAIPVCQGIYDQVNSYVGYGEILEPFPGGFCITGSEKNSVWYVFTVQSDGDLGFLLTPKIPKNDYDWAVFNLTGITCDSLFKIKNLSRVVSCNYSNQNDTTGGLTGPTGQTTQTTSGPNGSPFNALIPVKAGESYTIIISNFTSEVLGQGGYTLDFLQYSTAQIIDNIPPFITNIVTFSDCKIDSLEVNFSENVSCATVEIEDFVLRTPTNTIVIPSGISSNCTPTTLYEKKFTLYFNPPLLNDGQYQLEVVGSMADICNNTTVGNFSFDFNLNTIGLSAIADKNFLCFGDTSSIQISFLAPQDSLKFSVTPIDGISGDYKDGFIKASPSNSTTYTIVAENTSGCISSRVVSIEVNPQLQVKTIDNDSVCSGSPFILSTTITGGKAPYTYSWEPPLEISNVSILEPEVDPTVTRKYFITVTDSSGCISTDSVEIVVKGVGIINVTNFDSVSICECDSFYLDAGTDFDTFLWSPTNETTQRIYPKTTGLYTVDARSSGGCQAISRPVFVSAQTNSSIVSIVSPDRVSIGDTIDIIVTVTALSSGECMSPRSLIGSFEFNPSVLFPLNPQSFGVDISNRMRLLPINDTIKNSRNEYVYKYIVTFGSEPEIRFKTNPMLVSKCMVPAAIVEELTIPINDICFAGGSPRLFLSGSTGVGILSVSPNPSVDVATIRYQLREQGLTSIKVYSVLGNEVKNVLLQEQQAGTYDIDIQTSELSTGKYILQLITPTKTTAYSFEVIR